MYLSRQIAAGDLWQAGRVSSVHGVRVRVVKRVWPQVGVAVVLAVTVAGCGSGKTRAAPSTTSGISGPTTTPADKATASTATPLAPAATTVIKGTLPSGGGIDPCLVGDWKAKMFSLSGTGGAGATLQVRPDGSATEDFGPSAPFTGKVSTKLEGTATLSVTTSGTQYTTREVASSVTTNPPTGTTPPFPPPDLLSSNGIYRCTPNSLTFDAFSISAQYER